MKLTIKKSIAIADKNPALPIHKFIEGTTREVLDKHLSSRLIELGVATTETEKPKKEKMVKQDKIENKKMDLSKNKDKKK